MKYSIPLQANQKLNWLSRSVLWFSDYIRLIWCPNRECIDVPIDSVGVPIQSIGVPIDSIGVPINSIGVPIDSIGVPI